MNFVNYLNKFVLATMIVIASGPIIIISEEIALDEEETPMRFVDPFVIRNRRDSPEQQDEESRTLMVSIGNWTIEFANKNKRDEQAPIVSPKLEVQWVGDSDHGRAERSDRTALPECDLRQDGRVLGREKSIVVLTICSDNEFYGMIVVENRVWFVRPYANGGHVLQESSIVDHLDSQKDKSRPKRSGGCSRKAFFNLTGDTVHYEPTAGHNGNVQLLWRIKLDRMEEEQEISRSNNETKIGDNESGVGYYFDRMWDKTKLPKRNITGDELPQRWLEVAIAIDHTFIHFHGDKVKEYVFSIFNIVSAIYKDPSLDANIRVVIVRMILYSEQLNSKVVHGNIKKSLNNVNKWNRKLLTSRNENHDVAVWLTRVDLGGPSGFAPVSGACNPSRSCAIIRDEGLTSAFIIAHEIGHILGLTHDGDESVGNTCSHEASMGSVMAPVVRATFYHFNWSPCSRRELLSNVRRFECLNNKPKSSKFGREMPRANYSLDEQCRLEFGEGYSLCRDLNGISICSHLWCAHRNFTNICRTKKDPPLEGTICGENKRCINEHCEYLDKKKERHVEALTRLRNGGWSEWSPWSKCSRSCGIGVRSRYRVCNQTTSSKIRGKTVCKGSREDLITCQQSNCSINVDSRPLQCRRLPLLVRLDESSPKFSMTWLPHVPDDEGLGCRISCRSAETNEILTANREFLVDGTPCSYDSTNICVKGTCRRMGCDGIFNSKAQIDSCGVCNGDDTTCSKIAKKFSRQIQRGITRIATIVRNAWHVRVNVTIAAETPLAHENLTLTIQDRRKFRNDLNYFDTFGKGRNIVVEGGSFKSRRYGDSYEISSRGPFLSKVTILLVVPETSVRSGVTISIKSEYFVNTKDESRNKNSWMVSDWSPCSASCGGGIRHRTVKCKDEKLGRITKDRPCKLHERCNDFSCEHKWLAGKWQGCSTSCGSQGIQERAVFCVHSSFPGNNEIKSGNELRGYTVVESESLCDASNRPEMRRACNRVPCKSDDNYS